MLRTYETIYVTKIGTDDEGVNSINQKIKDIVEKSGGQSGVVEDWGVKDLAYKISKEFKGRYHYVNFTSDANVIKDLDFLLKINEAVLTSMTIKVSDIADLENVRRPNVKTLR